MKGLALVFQLLRFLAEGCVKPLLGKTARTRSVARASRALEQARQHPRQAALRAALGSGTGEIAVQQVRCKNIVRPGGANSALARDMGTKQLESVAWLIWNLWQIVQGSHPAGFWRPGEQLLCSTDQDIPDVTFRCAALSQRDQPDRERQQCAALLARSCQAESGAT